MLSLNDQIRTALLRRAVRQTRYENAVVRDVRRAWRAVLSPMLTLVRTSAIADLQASPLARLQGPTRLDQQQRVAELMQRLAGIWRGALRTVVQRLSLDLVAFAELELIEVPALIQTFLDRARVAAPLREVDEEPDLSGSLGVTFTQVPVAQMAQLLTSPLGGAFFLQSFGDLEVRVLTQLRTALTMGLLQGQGVPMVARAVQAALNNSRWQAERIVRSEYGRVAGQAAQLQFKQNERLLRGVQWISTLDQRTCCLAGTRILLASGDAKTIETVQPGESVMTRAGARLVTERLQRPYAGSFTLLQTSRAIVALTDEHPVWSGGDWKAAADLSVGDPLLEQTTQIFRGADLGLAHVDHAPPSSQETCITARLTLRIAMPVVTIYFESDLPGRESEVYRVAPRRILGNKAQTAQGSPHTPFEFILPPVASIAGVRAEHPHARQRPWLDPKSPVAVAAILHEGGTPTSLGAVLPVNLATEFSSAPSTAFLRADRPAGPGADRVAIGIALRNRERSMAARADFGDLSRPGKTQAGAIEPQTHVRDEGLSAAETSFGERSVECVVTRSGAKLPSAGRDISPSEALAAMLTCIRHCRGRHLVNIIEQFFHVWDGSVYNLEVKNEHEFFAEGILVHNCVQCGALDGRTWADPAKAPVPVLSSHPNCRCIISPVILGLPGVEFPTSTRASMSGQVSAKLTYPEWFKQQDADFQREVLGPTRYKLWRSGKLKLGDFSTAAGVRSVADALALARSR